MARRGPSGSKSRADAIYRAELEALFFGGWFINLEDTRRYLRWLVRTKFWRGRCAVRTVELEYARTEHSTSVIRNGIGYMHIGQARLCEQFVNHEAAHFIAPAAGHGPLFVIALVELTGFTLGNWFEQRLRHALEEEGIKV